MEYGLIGEKLGHSYSKEIHGLIGDYRYELKELTRGELEEFFVERDFKAINVTIPYKKEVIPYLTEIDPLAEKIGAVNTVVNRDGRLYGYNTDVYGMITLIERVLSKTGKRDMRGMKVLILGTGGTSLTATEAVSQLGAEKSVRFSRTGKDGAALYGELKNYCDADFLINCTPCGMYPKTHEQPVTLDGFTNLTGVVDAVYNPCRTPLVREAQRRGIASEGGLYMLVAQAIKAYEYFTGKKTGKTLEDGIFAKISAEKENIVLIGMPSSGKTTVGKILAKRLGRELIDTDRLVEKNEGRRISEIFRKDGEEYFRSAEKKAIFEAADRCGAIIATGGGTVLDGANIDALRANGRIYWLDRPLGDLMPTESRPTAQTRQDIERRYRERYGIYKSSCDKRVDCSGGFGKTISQIMGRYSKKTD